MNDQAEAPAEQQKIEVQPEFLMQAMQAALNDERHKNIMLSALVNQQQQQIAHQQVMIEQQSVVLASHETNGNGKTAKRGGRGASASD